MDNLTTIVRDEISRQYRSVRQFAFAVGGRQPDRKRVIR